MGEAALVCHVILSRQWLVEVSVNLWFRTRLIDVDKHTLPTELKRSVAGVQQLRFSNCLLLHTFTPTSYNLRAELLTHDSTSWSYTFISLVLSASTRLVKCDRGKDLGYFHACSTMRDVNKHKTTCHARHHLVTPHLLLFGLVAILWAYSILASLKRASFAVYHRRTRRCAAYRRFLCYALVCWRTALYRFDDPIIVSCKTGKIGIATLVVAWCFSRARATSCALCCTHPCFIQPPLRLQQLLECLQLQMRRLLLLPCEALVICLGNEVAAWDNMGTRLKLETLLVVATYFP